MAQQLCSLPADGRERAGREVARHIAHARPREIEILPPDVNEPQRDFSVVGSAIRFGFAGIKNVGEGAIEAILSARAKQPDGEESGAPVPFKSLFDFAERIEGRRVNRRVVEALVRCGAFDSVHENRAAVWQGLDATLERGAAAQRDREIGQGTLFGGPGGDSAVDAPPLPDVPPWTDRERLSFEKELLGFYVSGHPLGAVVGDLVRLTDTTASAVEGKDGREVRVGGLLTSLRETRTRQGKRMGFATLEDLEGSFELVIFSQGFSEHEKLLREALAAGDAGGEPLPLLVMGSLEVADPPKILVRDVLRLSQAQERLTAQLRVRVLEPDINRDTMVALRRVLTEHPGDCAVYVHIMMPGESETIVSVGGGGVQPSDELQREVDALFGRPVAECSL